MPTPCISRTAWERVPFRAVAYAEDRLLALDMLRAGYAKVFVPQAAVLHSHDYAAAEHMRRSFDEWRGLLEVYGWREPISPVHLARVTRGVLGEARRALIREGAPASQRRASLRAVAVHQLLRQLGALLGSHADRLGFRVRKRLSLEGRGGFAPLELDREIPMTSEPVGGR